MQPYGFPRLIGVAPGTVTFQLDGPGPLGCDSGCGCGGGGSRGPQERVELRLGYSGWIVIGAFVLGALVGRAR